VISLIVGGSLACIPVILAWKRLPADIVLAANNSAVISAACHSVPTETTELVGIESSREHLLVHDRNADNDLDQIEDDIGRPSESSQILYKMSIHALKWGVVSKSGNSPDQPGHLAFGNIYQDICPPKEGDWYANSKGRQSMSAGVCAFDKETVTPTSKDVDMRVSLVKELGYVGPYHDVLPVALYPGGS
jgi:hypothetical protein